jgi:hypothetical protein
MAFLSPQQIQVISDLHLETPFLRPLYDSFKLRNAPNNLFLLGDIGLCKDEGLFRFLERVLKSNPATKVFYIMGNHEFYQLTIDEAYKRMQDFSRRMAWHYSERFFLLSRRRYDLDSSTTILGCTLWTQLLPEQASELQLRLTDFNEMRGIRGRTVEQHNNEHAIDLKWLNEQVQQISQHEPRRQIIIATHHSPTVDNRSTIPRHVGSSVSSGFSTDLSNEPCWTSPNVRMWAFGHTHHSFHYYDHLCKLAIAEQKGYNRPEDMSVPQLPAVVVEIGSELYTVSKTKPKIETPNKGKETQRASSSAKLRPPQVPNKDLKGLLKKILGRR